MSERDFWLTPGLDISGTEKWFTASPFSPTAVARDIANRWYLQGEELVLRHWRYDHYVYSGGVWLKAEVSGLRATIYEKLDSALYVSRRFGEMPWNPNPRKVNDVIDALKAIEYLDGNTEPGVWLNETRATIPAAGTVVVKNGLLHVPTRTLVPHSPAFWAHNRLPYDFDESCSLPERWLGFLNDLWRAWREWCNEQNLPPGTKATFGRDLKAAAPSIRRVRLGNDSRTYTYEGIGLLERGTITNP